MKKTLTILSSVTMILMLVAASFTNASAAPLLQDGTVPLHGSHVGATNPGFSAGSCPTPPQAGWWGWHFIMPGNNNFTSLTVTFQNAGTFSASSFPGVFVAHPDNSHAYIWTPGPDTLLGGSATSDGANEFFNLSHVCAGGETPTPTDPPTETPTPTNTPTETPTPTNTPTETPTPTNTPTETPTPTSELGQLKLCKSAGIGVTKGQVFTFSVNNTSYDVQAGYCVLAGQFPLNTQVTIKENIPAGYFVERITIAPSDRTVSNSIALGEAVVKIGLGITEVTFRNATATSTSTKTPEPPTPPQGYMQVCKQADGYGVSGYFMFRFAGQSRSVPVGSCSSLVFNLTPGTLTITEDAQAGYQVTDIYTIPADRLISKDLSTRTATVTIVPSNGDASTQTVVVFVNKRVELGQLKLCKATGLGVTKGQPFSFTVGNTNYTVKAGYCVLAGQYPLNTQVNIKENKSDGYSVHSINVQPDGRTVSKNVPLGEVVVKIGSGITEVIYKNSFSTSTKTPEPPTPPQGYMQICKQADGAGVSGYFMFRFAGQSRSVPVGSCSSLVFNLTPGTLTVTEDAQAGYQVSDIYTIPADRLISKNINAGSVTVTIVPSNGDASTQTVVVFVNRAVTQLDALLQFLSGGQ